MVRVFPRSILLTKNITITFSNSPLLNQPISDIVNSINIGTFGPHRHEVQM